MNRNWIKQKSDLPDCVCNVDYVCMFRSVWIWHKIWHVHIYVFMNFLCICIKHLSCILKLQKWISKVCLVGHGRVLLCLHQRIILLLIKKKMHTMLHNYAVQWYRKSVNINISNNTECLPIKVYILIGSVHNIR